MKKYLYTKIFSVALLILTFGNVIAQPMYSYNAATVTSTANVYPWATTLGNKLQGLYQPTMFTGVSGVAPSGLITKIYWQVGTSTNATASYTNLDIKMGHSAITTLVSGPWNTGLTTVFTAANHNVAGIAPNAWIQFTLQTPFPYNNTQNLIIESSSTNYVGGFNVLNATPPYNGRLYGTTGSTTGTAGAQLCNFGFDLAPATPCTGVPVPGTIADIPAPCPNKPFTLNMAGVGFVANLSYQWQSSPDGNNWFDLPGGTNLNYTTSITAPTYFRVRVTCANSGLSAYTPVKLLTPTFLNCYCVPTYASAGTADNITEVELLNLLNNTVSTSNAPPGYYDYTPQQPATLPIPMLVKQTSATLKVKYGTDPNQYVGVWIDFNRNGLFDTTEYISPLTNAGANGQHNIVINVPDTASEGITRMRIRGGDDAQNLNTQPCGATNSAWGEAEDYFIEIGFPPCDGAASAGDLTASDTSMCPGYTFVLTDTNYTKQRSGLTRSWQFSPDNVTWIDEANTTNKDTVERLFTSGPVFYRVKMECSYTNTTSYSNVVRINNKPAYKCYCYSQSLGGSNDTTDAGVFTLGNFSINVGGPHLMNQLAFRRRTDYTDLPPIDLWTDSTYHVDIKHIMKGTFHRNARVNLFIDFNNNLKYDLPHERVFSEITSTSNFVISRSFTVPDSAIVLYPTGMRMIITEDLGNDSACGSYVSGETEDFMVILHRAFPVGVGSINDVNHLSVYPNPSTGKFFVEFDANGKINTAVITVTAITGQQLLRREYADVAGKFKQELDMSQFAKGVYFVELDVNGEKINRKITIQ